jgi:hypothetical protein
MSKSINSLYLKDMYMLEKIRILLEYIGKISARFLSSVYRSVKNQI